MTIGINLWTIGVCLLSRAKADIETGKIIVSTPNFGRLLFSDCSGLFSLDDSGVYINRGSTNLGLTKDWTSLRGVGSEW